MNKKGFSQVLILIVLAVVVGYLVYDYNAANNSIASTGIIDKPISVISSGSTPEDKQLCPTIVNNVWKSPKLYKKNFMEEELGLEMNALINLSVWTIEKSAGSCYQGHYAGQNPNWFYCTDMVVSRWDLSSSGTINHRWYTTATIEWQKNGTEVNSPYIPRGITCENGEAFVVNKGETKFYFKDTREGAPINIEVSGDATPVNLVYP